MPRYPKLLTFAALLASATTALATTPPMPRVLHALPFLASEGGYVSANSLQMNGRTVAFVLQEVRCPPAEDCTVEYTVSEYDGVSRRELFTTSSFVLSAKLSADLFVWQVSTIGTDYPLWAAARGGEARLLTDASWGNAYDVSGKRVVWGEYDENNFVYEILLDGKIVTTAAEPQPAPFGGAPVMAGNSIVIPVEDPTQTAFVLARRGSRKYRPLPPLLPDQTVTAVEVGRKGDKVIFLKRDFIDEGTGEDPHHELSIYDVSSKKTRSIPLENAPIQGFDYDGGKYFPWLRGSDMGPMLQITDVDTGETQEDVDLGSGDAIPGNLAEGFFSFVIPIAGPRLYDVATRQIEVVAYSGGENGVASFGRAIAWEAYDASFANLTLYVSYPADQAVMAIVDAVKGYGLPGAQKQRLLKPLNTTRRALDQGAFDAARQAMQDFVGDINSTAGLGAERAAALTNAGQLVIDALSS